MIVDKRFYSDALLAAATLHALARDRLNPAAADIYMRAATRMAPWLDMKAKNLGKAAAALSPLSEDEIHERTLVGLGIPSVHVRIE